MKNDYKNIILDQITYYINTQNLEGLNIIVKLLAGNLNDSYNDFFSNIEIKSHNYVIDGFNNKDFKNISNMIIVCNNTIKIIKKNCSEQIIQEYFDWVLVEITNTKDCTLALHLAKKCVKFKRFLNYKIATHELDGALKDVCFKYTFNYMPGKFFSFVKI